MFVLYVCIGVYVTEVLGVRSQPRTFIGHRGAIRSLLVLDGGTCLVSASDDKTIRIWNLNWLTFQEECLHLLKGHNDSICSIVKGRFGELLTW